MIRGCTAAHTCVASGDSWLLLVSSISFAQFFCSTFLFHSFVTFFFTFSFGQLWLLHLTQSVGVSYPSTKAGKQPGRAVTDRVLLCRPFFRGGTPSMQVAAAPWNCQRGYPSTPLPARALRSAATAAALTSGVHAFANQQDEVAFGGHEFKALKILRLNFAIWSCSCPAAHVIDQIVM